MDKIIVYGTGKAYINYQPLFQKYSINKELQVVAVIKRSESDAKNIPSGLISITLKDLDQFVFDRILLGVNLDEFTAARQTLTDLGIDPAKIIGLSQYFLTLEQKSKYYDDIIDKQLAVIQKILTADDQEISDYQWMYNTLGEFGMRPLDTHDQKDIFWTEWGIFQIMEEFVPFCNMIGCMEGIREAIEIGVFRGRSSYFMCALLSRKNPGLKYTLVDICDNLDSFERYHQLLPALDKQIPSTSEDYKDKAYDFVFIDADHSYDASMQDYLYVGQHARKITVFHDIYAHEYDHLNGGTVRMWKEVVNLTENKTHKIFSKFPDKWMGIGCVII